MASATLAYDYLTAMAAAIRTAIAGVDPGGNVLVDFGYPEPHRADDMILLIELDVDQSYGPLDTNRNRNEVINLQVHFCSRRSDQDQANRAAFDGLVSRRLPGWVPSVAHRFVDQTVYREAVAFVRAVQGDPQHPARGAVAAAWR